MARPSPLLLPSHSRISQLGKLTLDKTFQERDHLNVQIVAQINAAAANWGTEVLRYEVRTMGRWSNMRQCYQRATYRPHFPPQSQIKDITPPSGVRAAMEMQAEAERRKRAQVRSMMGGSGAVLVK